MGQINFIIRSKVRFESKGSGAKTIALSCPGGVDIHPRSRGCGGDEGDCVVRVWWEVLRDRDSRTRFESSETRAPLVLDLDGYVL